MKKPLISIIICCHNRAKLLPQTISSALAQTYRPVEIIVYDDGSTDDTPILMDNYRNRVRYYWQENQGVALTRTKACYFAKGDYISFLDDDDIMPPDKLTVLYEALCQYPSAIFSVGDLIVIDNDYNYFSDSSLDKKYMESYETRLISNGYEAVLWPRVQAAPHTTLFRKIHGKKIEWFDKQYRYASEDKDFFARLGRLGPIVHVSKIVSYYRRGHDSLSSNRIRSQYGRLLLFVNHLETLGPHRNALHRRLKLRILESLKKIALYKSKGIEVPDLVPNDYLTKGLSILPFSYRLSYLWSALIKYPIRRLVKGSK